MKLNMVRFGWPTPDTPYYFLHLRAENVTQDTEVAGVTVNGRRCRDFEARNDGRAAVPPVLRAQADKRELYIRVDWQKGDTFDVAVTLKSGENSVELRESYAAAQEHGYWNKDWKYYAAHVVKETAGIDRVDEPVHAVLAMYMDRLTDAQRELRVVEVDSHTGEAREIRSQVYAVSNWDKWQNINCQPTTTAQISRQDRETVRLGPSFRRIQAATKFPRILAAEMALLTEEGMVYTPNSWAMSVVTMDPTIQEALKKQ